MSDEPDYMASVPDLLEAYYVAGRFVDGQSVAEIASEAGVPGEKIEGRLRDLLRHLKRIVYCVVCEEQARAEITQQAIDSYARSHGWDPLSGVASNDWVDGILDDDLGTMPRAITLADMLGLARGDPL